MVITHDRWFLDRIATHVLAFEGDSQVRWFEGNFSEYEERRKAGTRRGRRPAPPHQVQEDPLTRVSPDRPGIPRPPHTPVDRKHPDQTQTDTG